MKKWFTTTLLIASLGVFITSCGNKTETTSTEEQQVMPAGDGTITPVTPAEGQAAATGAPGQAHYICTKAGCSGTGDAQGKCPVCGSDLSHNAAFHNTAPGTTPGTTPQNAVTLDPATGKTTTPVTNATPPAEKNAAGVYHHTCTKAGCDGGAGSPGKCPKCGSELAHNPAYHNN